VLHPPFRRSGAPAGQAINPAAAVFGALFIIEAFVFVWTGVVYDALTFTLDRKPHALVSGFFILYAMVLYPLLGLAFGHVCPASPVFGVAPCRVTIFTLGMLLWTSANTPKWVLAVPLL
jgi:Family of unknown function (DUF6064)